MKAQGKRMIVTGLLIAGVGLLLTLGSYSNASEDGGGGYVILWGPVAYGIYRAFRGFLLVTSDRSPRASQYTISSPSAHPIPRPVETDVTPAVKDPALPRAAHLQAFPPAPTSSDVVPQVLDAPSQPGFGDSWETWTPDAVRPAEPEGLQQGGDQPQLRKYRQATPVPWWGWAAPAVVAVVLLVIAISAATSKPALEDVQQEAANLAFAERTFAETHGRFTDDIAELGYRPSDGMDVRVVTTIQDNKFCVDAVSGDYSARAYDSSFSSDGEAVRGFGGLCEGPIRPGESSVAPSWLDTSLAEPEDTLPVETEETKPLRENGLTAEEIVDSFTHRMIARYCESYYLLGLHDRSVTIYQHQLAKSGTDISWPFAEAIVDEIISRCP